MDIKINIASTLKSLIKLKNISQKELSKKIEITDRYMTDLCTNKKIPSHKILSSISKELDVNFILSFQIIKENVIINLKIIEG